MRGENITAADKLVGDEKVTTTTSPRLNPTTNGGGLKATADTATGQHARQPSWLSSPPAQGKQYDEFVAARASLNVPAGQGVQDAAETTPRLDEKRPAGAGLRGPPSQKKPIGQITAVAVEEPAGHSYPGRQVPVQFGDVSESDEPKRPSGHGACQARTRGRTVERMLSLCRGLRYTEAAA
jgi:hypothetical protein